MKQRLIDAANRGMDLVLYGQCQGECVGSAMGLMAGTLLLLPLSTVDLPAYVGVHCILGWAWGLLFVVSAASSLLAIWLDCKTWRRRTTAVQAFLFLYWGLSIWWTTPAALLGYMWTLMGLSACWTFLRFHTKLVQVNGHTARVPD